MWTADLLAPASWLMAVCVVSLAGVAPFGPTSVLAQGDPTARASVFAGLVGSQDVGPEAVKPTLTEVSNNRTKRAMRPEKKWVALVGYEPVLEDPMPKASDGFLHKVEVQGTGRCLDGSWPVYYYAYGSEPTKWVIDLEGGDWCTRFEGGMDKEERGKDYRRDCFERRDQGGLQGGTTKDDKETLSLDWLGKEAHYFSNSTKRNPLMHGWNKVFIRNCDGSSFTSGRPEAWTGITDDSDDDDDNNFIYTQGKLILDSVLQDLLIHRHLGHADEVVLAGCSAGGLAVILHLDSVAETIRRTAAQLWRPDPKAIKVRGLADSGFFLDEACGGSDKNYRARMKFLYDYHFSHNGLNPKCTAHYNATGEFYKCLFAENALRFLETPVFLAQSLLDGWALTWIGCDNENEFKTKMKNKLAEAVSIPENGGFMDSCRHHCHCHEAIEIRGTNHVDAFKSWYEGGPTRIWFSEECQTKFSSPECPEKDG